MTIENGERNTVSDYVKWYARRDTKNALLACRCPLLWPLLLLPGLAQLPAAEPPVKPLENRTVVADGRHNAFASLAYWRGRYWLAFRKGTGHVARDGDLFVLHSQDTTSWTQARAWDVAGDDRDAQLLVTKERLFLYINSLDQSGFHVSVTFTDDGLRWSEPQPVYRPGFVLWKPVVHAGRLYAGAHRPGPVSHRLAHLVTSRDGIGWEQVSTIRAGQGESETLLSFGTQGRVTAFLRSQVTVGGFILESLPPYQQWSQRPAGVHLSGQSVYTFDGVTYLISRLLRYTPPAASAAARAEVAGRPIDQATMVYTYDKGRLNPYCLLGPLQGNHDSSYATAVRDGDAMLVVYHRSGHEYGGEFAAKDSADLWLARVPLRSGKPAP